MRARPLIAALLVPALFGIAVARGEAAGGDTFRTDSALVLVNVSVLGPHDQPVTTLPRESFRVLDNGKEQDIRFFAHEETAISLAIILDASGSMKPYWTRAQSMLTRLCDLLEPRDELFLIAVHQHVELLIDAGSGCNNLASRLAATEPHGMTALLDAIPLATAKLRQARNPRHAVLAISDGGENASRVRLSELRRQVVEANAQIYSATVNLLTDNYVNTYELRGPELLAEFAALTGGRTFAIDDRRAIPTVALALARELHDQYVLGYQSPEPAGSGKRHRIAVKVQRDAAAPRLTLFHRSSYVD